MPSCVFRNCNNDTLTVKELKNLSFHALPKDRLIREKWLRAIRMQRREDDWIPTTGSTVCSEHFLSSDLYSAKKNIKLKKTAVPMVETSSNFSSQHIEKDTPILNKICRTCLATDVKMFALNKCELWVAFEDVTGLTSNNNNLPQSLCFECAHALSKCLQFKNKSLTADKHMKLLLQKHKELSLKHFETIDRLQNNLASTLSSHIIIDDQENVVNDSDFKIECSLEIGNADDIKQEKEICDENVDINNIDVASETDLMENDNESIISNGNESVYNYEELSNENLDVFLMKKCEYTSEDDLPLEYCKKSIKSNDDKIKKNKEDNVPKKRGRKKIIKDPELPKVDRRKKPFLNDLNGALFTIKDLTKEEQLEEIENRKESTNYKNSPFKCNVCYKGFSDTLAYSNHALKHDDQSGDYVCDVCKTRFKLSRALTKHFTAHHTQKFFCTRCPFITTHRQTAKLHERWHSGTKYTCQHCLETFIRFTTYMGHLRIKHPSDFVCQLCGFSFVSDKGLNLHKQLKHKFDDQKLEEGPLCEPCDIRFTSLAALQRHMSVSQKHSAGKKSRNEYIAREKVHDGHSDRFRYVVYPTQRKDKFEGPISCEQCNVQLKDSREYHLHFRKTHPDKNRTMYPAMKTPCMCEVCGRIFQSFSLLRDHRWIHSEGKAFKCDQCNKTFTMKQRLVAHMKVHSEVKPTYPCSVCGKGFSNHSNRRRHMAIHTGLKPFKCEMCGKSFKLGSEKRAHITYVHLKKPWPKRARARRQDRRNAPSQNQPPLNSSDGMAVQHQIPWPCDPKVNEMGQIIDNSKPMYYNLKM